MDPILMHYRDPVKEKNFSDTLQSQIDAKRTKGQAGQPFNIVNHEGPPKKNMFLGSQNRDARKWNLLSHMPKKLHAIAPTTFDENFQIECTRRKSVLHDGDKLVRGRDYSILSNKFNENDSARRLEEHMKIQDHIRKEYYRTHIYDPIKAQSYDESNEKDWQVRHLDEIKRRRQRQEKSIPRRCVEQQVNVVNIYFLLS